jgi:hypothetical protein
MRSADLAASGGTTFVEIAVRVTVTVYVFTEPSQEVETTESTFPEPTVSACAADAEPVVVYVLPEILEDTVIEPPAIFAVGVKVTDATAFFTVAV